VLAINSSSLGDGGKRSAEEEGVAGRRGGTRERRRGGRTRGGRVGMPYFMRAS
jgi:hypothetical protein